MFVESFDSAVLRFPKEHLVNLTAVGGLHRPHRNPTPSQVPDFFFLFRACSTPCRSLKTRHRMCEAWHRRCRSGFPATPCWTVARHSLLAKFATRYSRHRSRVRCALQRLDRLRCFYHMTSQAWSRVLILVIERF